MEIAIAETPQEIAAVRHLCRGVVSWLLKEFPERRDRIMSYFEPVRWQVTLAGLPQIHARPKGVMLLAWAGDVPAGCVMYHEMFPGVAEVKRFFVSPRARGHGGCLSPR